MKMIRIERSLRYKPGVNHVTESAKAEFTRAKDRLAKNLAATPDDRLSWSPAPSARTPIQIVAHAGLSLPHMTAWLSGKSFDFPSMADLDVACRAEEASITTREQAVEVLEKNSHAYCAWLDSLSDDQLASTLELAFGTFPMKDAITFAADHTRNHAGQLEYLQTIYGDREMH